MKPLHWILILAFLALIASCKDKTQHSETDNLFKFKEYISYNTYGKLSITTDIRVELAKPLEQFELTQEISADEYLKISPATKGKLVVENGKTLIFQPSEYLKPDTEYTVTVKLDKFYEDISKEFKTYTFSFKTITPNFKVDIGKLQSYSKQWQYVEASVEASDVISLEKAKQLVSASQDGKKLKLKWPSESTDARYYNFIIDSISRKMNDSEILIKWDGKPIDAETKGENTFAIPGQNNFTIVDISSTLAPAALLSINFSDPLLENQDFAGLVTIENTTDLRYEVDGNVLNVYPPNRVIGDVKVTIFTGIKNTEGFGLKKEFSELVSFEQLKPAVRMISKGVILPNSASTPVYFEAVNLSKVDVRVIKIYESNVLQFLQSYNLNDNNTYDIKRVGRRITKKTIELKNTDLGNNGSWKAYAINLSEYFKADPGAIYQLELSFKKDYITYDCTENASEEIEETDEEGDEYYDDYYEEDPYYANDSSEDEEIREERYWDNEIYRWRNYNYNWEQQDNPCHPAYYNEERVVTANILGSDLGLIVKKGNNRSYHFFTTNLISAKPEGGVKIKIFNYQQQLIETVTTESDGSTLYDSNKNAAFAVAQKGNNFAYIKLEDGNALSMSSFDISGKELQKGLKGYTYTERGVYRPGDSIHLTFVLNDNANPLPKNHPVTLSVTDARGKLVQRTVSSSSKNSSAENGFYYFPISTDASAPTGNWNATITVGGAQFSHTLKVATIKPNRLKIKLDFEDEILDATKPVKGTVSAMWLHGSPARNLKIDMTATLRASNSAFPKFPKYNFIDPIRTFSEVEIPVLDAQLSSEGSTTFSQNLEVGKNAPGMLTATFLTKVYEGGGDFSMDIFSKDLAPFSHFVGLKSPESGRYGSYFTDENTNFDVVSVDAQGKAAGNRELEVKVFQIEWRWWWNRGEDNLSTYENSTVHRPVKEFTVKTDGSGKGKFTVNIPEDEGGRYLIRVIDKQSGHATGRVTYFYRNWWQRPSDGDTESARMLLFSADKEKYNVGEEAFITFPSGSDGHALISVENGTEVLATHWIETKKGETKAAIKITKEMAPNIYVNISLLQPHSQTKNDLPIRLYGVIPLSVEDPSTVLHPKITMLKVLKPEKAFTVKVSEENNKPMTYTIAVVDEGLLDLTRFATPDIHEGFYSREALGVKTFDMFDYVIGAYSGSVDNIYAIGGGDAALGAKNRKADRFKPVVKYLGPFELDAGKTATHTIMMPNYIGSVRTMVIAGDKTKSAYGNAEKSTPVRTPLMVLASLPRKLSPGETVTLPVTVFAMENKVKTATITVKTGDALKAKNGSSKKVTFNGPGEQIVNFEFEVSAAFNVTDAVQTIEVTASGNGEKASYKVEIDVENPNPISQKSTQYTIAEKGSQTINFETFGVPGSNAAMLEFSTLPPMDFGKRMEYLIRYPYGCMEQITSSAFPQLYLADVFDITFDKKQKIEKNIKAAIERLGRFQTANGGLAYWPGEREADEWGTNYAGHFMLEAKQKGYSLPISFMSNWLLYQQNTARQWRNSYAQYNSSLTQAYRLYTLALAGKPELAAMNRLRESKELSNDAKWRLAAAYALAGKKEVAQQIAQTASINFQPEKYDYYTYGSPFRNRSMALETLVLLGDAKQRDLAISVAKDLSSGNWYSTQETSYALMAMAKMVAKNGGKAMELTFTNGGKSVEVKTDRAVSQRELSFVMGNNSVSVTNKKGNIVYVTLSQRGKLPLGNELAEQRNLSIKSQYLDGVGKAIDVTKLRQGTEIIAKVSVTNTSGDKINNVALAKIFPSGWEIVNTSFSELGGGASGNARYTDIRDDRVNFFFDLSKNETKTFTVKLNASYLGTYYLPGTQVEAMYDNSYYARNKGMWVTVEL